MRLCVRRKRGRIRPAERIRTYTGQKLDRSRTEAGQKRGKPGQKREKLPPVFRQNVGTLRNVKRLVSRSFLRLLNVLWANLFTQVVG